MMVFFLSIFTAGIVALLLVQSMDVECVKPQMSRKLVKPQAAKVQAKPSYAEAPAQAQRA